MDGNLAIAIIWLVILGLIQLSSFWRENAGEAALAATKASTTDENKRKYCRLAVLAGNKEACKIYQYTHINIFENHQPLKPFRKSGLKMVFYGFYYPPRYSDYLSEEQRQFSQSLYRFKDGTDHGIEFFKKCRDVLDLDGEYTIMFMPCSSEYKYYSRFKRLSWYIYTHCPNMTSGLKFLNIDEERESLHSIKGTKRGVLHKNYTIEENLDGKNIIIVDDVLTTGASALDYKAAIETKGGKVVAAMFFGKTVTKPYPLAVKLRVWTMYILRRGC